MATNKTKTPARPKSASKNAPFRFYDNRQKYLTFVNTSNEKSAVARRVGKELAHLHPSPPAFRMFDAGMGDATILSKLMRQINALHPAVPLLVVAKEISFEDVRLGLEKMPDRFVEHPATVMVITNLNYAEAPRLMTSDVQAAAAFNWQEIRLTGTSSHDYAEQIEALSGILTYGWQTKPSLKTGNPVYVRPTVLVLYRADHKFILDSVIPKPGRAIDGYDLVLASQPWRARMSAQFKASRVLAPLTRALAPGGKLIAVQSCGNDPGLEIVRKIWPDENPFAIDRHQLIAALKIELGRDTRDFTIPNLPDQKAIFRYHMQTLPSEIGDRVGTSTLLAAWNAATYVAQIEDERIDRVVRTPQYVDVTSEVLKKHGGLWFNDEAFVVTRRRP
jgi:hypothetical protein